MPPVPAGVAQRLLLPNDGPRRVAVMPGHLGYLHLRNPCRAGVRMALPQLNVTYVILPVSCPGEASMSGCSPTPTGTASPAPPVPTDGDVASVAPYGTLLPVSTGGGRG